jgi:hypothetical protein
VTLTDLYANQIEAHFFFYLMVGACTICLCLTMYVSAKIVADALAQQKVLMVNAPRRISLLNQKVITQ